MAHWSKFTSATEKQGMMLDQIARKLGVGGVGDGMDLLMQVGGGMSRSKVGKLDRASMRLLIDLAVEAGQRGSVDRPEALAERITRHRDWLHNNEGRPDDEVCILSPGDTREWLEAHRLYTGGARRGDVRAARLAILAEIDPPKKTEAAAVAKAAEQIPSLREAPLTDAERVAYDALIALDRESQARVIAAVDIARAASAVAA